MYGIYFMHLHVQNGKVTDDSRCIGTLIKNAYTREGSRFTGWNTAEGGSGYPYDDKAMPSMSEKEITLYAQWEQSIKYLHHKQERLNEQIKIH